MMDQLEIKPFGKKLEGNVEVPGSKSISNRALLFAALCEGETILNGLLKSEDTELMVDCLRSLGVGVEALTQTSVKITGCGAAFTELSADLYVGTAGTVARMLVGVLGVQPSGRFRIDGSEVMRKRPMKGLTDLLQQIGCEIEFEGADGALPFVLKPNGFKRSQWVVDASASSQVLSAALMIAPMAKTPIEIKLEKPGIRRPYVIMTAKMMAAFGVNEVSWNEAFTHFQVEKTTGYQVGSGVYEIEPDASAASYFLTLPLVVGGSLNVAGVLMDGLQGDAAYTEVLSALGMEVKTSENGVCVSAQSWIKRSHVFDFYPISDTFMTLAAISPLLSHPLKIEGIAHTRNQESDRVHAMATELGKLGQEVEEGNDYLHIFPNLNHLREVARAGVAIDTYRDHRISMSFGILGSKDLLGNQVPWMTINDPLCCQKTFPLFFEVLESLRS